MFGQGADANFTSSRQFREIQNKELTVHQKVLHPTQIYRGVTGDPCLTRRISANMVVALQIRHGSCLNFKKHKLKDNREGNNISNS